MGNARAGLLPGCGCARRLAAAALLLLSAAWSLAGASPRKLDLTRPCIAFGSGKNFVRNVREAAAAGYRIILDDGGIVFMARQTSPPDTYRYVWLPDETISPAPKGQSSSLNRINHLGALGYRLTPWLAGWGVLMEKAPHPQNWHYELQQPEFLGTQNKSHHPILGLLSPGLPTPNHGGVDMEAPGARYRYHSALCCNLVRTHGLHTRWAIQILFEAPGEASANDIPTPEGKVWLVHERDLPPYAGKGYRVLQWIFSGTGKGFLLEKPSDQEETYDQRLIGKSKDTAAMETKLNAAGKDGFHLLFTSILSHTLVVQKASEAPVQHYGYRIAQMRGGHGLAQVLVDACNGGFYPVAVDSRAGFLHSALLVYFEKKSSTQVASQEAPQAPAASTESKPNASNEEPSPTVLSNETPVEIELLTEVSSNFPTSRTPVPFKIVEPVRVNGRTVIAGGAPVRAEALTHPPAHWQKPGSIVLSRPHTTAVDGTAIRLRFASWARPKEQNKVARASQMIGAGMLDSLIAFGGGGALLWPIIPFIEASKGEKATIPAGERFQVYVDGDFKIRPKEAPVPARPQQ